MKKGPIGIFDSGVGGLTVLKEIQKQIPNETIIYLGDTKNFPYGGKEKEEIIKLAIKNTEILIEKGCKIVIVACGTATSQAIETLQKMFSIPIIGIIEPTIKYVNKKNIKRIGVIATKGTIRSKAWETNLKNQDSEIEVFSQACPMLAEIAEEGRAKSIEGKNAIREYMKIFKKEKINHIILGCTHYPIYESLIQQELGYPVELIHTGISIANDLKNILELNENKEIKKEEDRIFLTKASSDFEKIVHDVFHINISIQELKE